MADHEFVPLFYFYFYIYCFYIRKLKIKKNQKLKIKKNQKIKNHIFFRGFYKTAKKMPPCCPCVFPSEWNAHTCNSQENDHKHNQEWTHVIHEYMWLSRVI